MVNYRSGLPLDQQFRRGWRKRVLKERLAKEAVPDIVAVAAEFDTDYQTVWDFNTNNAVEIQAIRDDWAVDPNDQFAGIAEKRREVRVEEMLDEVRTCNRMLIKMEDAGDEETDTFKMIAKLKQEFLEFIARELGQSKPAVDASGGVSFVINGIDLGALT